MIGNNDRRLGDFTTWLHEDYPELYGPVLRWAICPDCHGHGTTTAHLGSYTEVDRVEMGDEWLDFAEDVRNGVHDRPCPECAGCGKVLEVDPDKTHPETLRHWGSYLNDYYDDLRMQEMERRAGA